MTECPSSLIDFQRRFPDEAACAAWLTELRWPDGFRCPACGHDDAWSLRTKPWTFECRACRRQTSDETSRFEEGSFNVSVAIKMRRRGPNGRPNSFRSSLEMPRRSRTPNFVFNKYVAVFA